LIRENEYFSFPLTSHVGFSRQVIRKEIYAARCYCQVKLRYTDRSF